MRFEALSRHHVMHSFHFIDFLTYGLLSSSCHVPCRVCHLTIPPESQNKVFAGVGTGSAFTITHPTVQYTQEPKMQSQMSTTSAYAPPLPPTARPAFASPVASPRAISPLAISPLPRRALRCSKCAASRRQLPTMGSARRPRAPRARTREDAGEAARSDPWTPGKLGFLQVGTVVGAHGVRGEAKVRADTDFGRQRLGAVANAAQRYLLMPGRRYPRPVEVENGRKATQPDVWICRVAGMRNRESVEGLQGATIFVKESDRPRMSRDEYLVGDLVGMKVALVEEPEVWVGVVRSVVTREDLCAASGGGAAAAAVAADLLEIATGRSGVDDGIGDASLIPFVKAIVPIVSRKDRVILIDPPEGLLDITRVNDKYKPPPPRGLLMVAKDGD